MSETANHAKTVKYSNNSYNSKITSGLSVLKSGGRDPLKGRADKQKGSPAHAIQKKAFFGTKGGPTPRPPDPRL